MPDIACFNVQRTNHQGILVGKYWLGLVGIGIWHITNIANQQVIAGTIYCLGMSLTSNPKPELTGHIWTPTPCKDSWKGHQHLVDLPTNSQWFSNTKPGICCLNPLVSCLNPNYWWQKMPANITKVVGHSKSPCVMVKSPYLTIFHGQWIEHLRLAPREDLSEWSPTENFKEEIAQGQQYVYREFPNFGEICHHYNSLHSEPEPEQRP